MKYMLYQIFCTSFFLLLSSVAFAQNGTIRGTITDAETGEALIGVTVVVEGTTNGAATDLDGKYTLQLAPGTYNLKISYVSYETKTITGIVVEAGQLALMDVKLAEASATLSEIVVEAKAERNNEAAILTLQKNSSLVLDGISAQLFSKTGDNDAASAIRRVTGVSVEGGKYVYVRGLGDRYTKTSLNNADIPSLDPNRNSVQLDIFPANLIDNLVVYKTFSADLPGDFTGGLVNVVTKDFPDQFTLQVNSSFGYNANATFNNNFLFYQGSSTDWLGFDNGDRDLPVADVNTIPFTGQASSNQALALQLDQITRSFNNVMVGNTDRTPFFSQRHSLSVGNQLNLLGRPFGFIFGLSYQNDYEFYEGGEVGQYVNAGGGSASLSPLLTTTDTQGSNNVLLGALLNLSYKFSDKNKISFNVLRNQSGTSSARYQIGNFPQNFDNEVVFETRTLQYLERALTNFQLKGEHSIPSLANLKIDWHAAYTISQQDEPDLRFFANDYLVEANGDTSFVISGSNYQLPGRFFRNLDETNLDAKLNFTFSYKAFKGLESKLKFGGAYLLKDREFQELRLTYQNPTNPENNFNGNPSDYVAADNVGLTSQIGNSFLFGPHIQNASEARNAYDASQNIFAAYVLTDLQITKSLKLNLGARLEITDIEVISRDASLDRGILDNTDILPAVNLVWELIKNMNLRFSYSRTLARPTFREIAPYASFDFVGDFILVGNQALKRTLIDNFDLRWEMYPRPGELFSVSLFYKNFSNPIERFFDLRAQNKQITYRNVNNANVIGVELEVRKKLDFISPSFANFQIGLNASFISSNIDIDPQELAQLRSSNPDQEATRPLFAQSPFLINALIDYNNPDSGTEISLSYNVFGERLSVVSSGSTPYVFEQPRNTLNLTISQKLGQQDRWKITLRGSNLLNPDYNFTYEFRGQKVPFRKYQLGQDFSVGVSYTID
ncbi:MAG: TonB-dependent receptor [Microscillaceae bacterium]